MISSEYDKEAFLYDGSGGGGYTYQEPISTLEPEPIIIADPEIDEPEYLIKPTYQEPVFTIQEPISTLEPEPIITREPIITADPEIAEPEYIKPVYEPISVSDPEPVKQTITTKQPVMNTKTIQVLDDTGMPMLGAHVYFSQNEGTTTDIDGFAKVSSSDPNRKVYVSFMGFQTRSFPFSQLPSEVVLTVDQNTLDEVIIDAKLPEAKKKSIVPLAMGGGLAALLLVLALRSKKPKKVTI